MRVLYHVRVEILSMSPLVDSDCQKHKSTLGLHQMGNKNWKNLEIEA